MRKLLLGLGLLLVGGTAVAQHHRDSKDAFVADSQKAFTATPAFAPDGTLWLVRANADRVVVVKSNDLGRSFSPPVAVTPEPMNLDWGPDARARIAVDPKGGLVVTFAIFQDKRFNGRAFSARSSDNGVSFTRPQPLTADTTSQRFESAAIDPAGRVFAAWLDKRNVAPAVAAGRPYPGAALAYAWSDDGAAFGNTSIALDNTCECCRLAIAFAGPGQPVIAFRNIFKGSIRDHAVVTFKDATTPGPLRRVSVDDWKLEACPHQGPSLAIAPDGSQHVAWFTDGAARKGLFYARAEFGRRSLRPATRPVLARPPAGAALSARQRSGAASRVEGVRRHQGAGALAAEPRQRPHLERRANRRRYRRRFGPSAAGRARRACLSLVADQGPGLSPDPAGGPTVRLAILLALLLGLSSLCGAQAAGPLSFERGSWATLRASHAGQPTVIHFWGLTCGPCLVELPQWGKLQAERPDLRLVLIAADPLPQEPERVAAMLAQADLGNSESWSFTDRFYERLRYEIDPAWAGELPRTLMIDGDGKITVLPGVADLARVRAWLDAQSKARP